MAARPRLPATRARVSAASLFGVGAIVLLEFQKQTRRGRNVAARKRFDPVANLGQAQHLGAVEQSLPALTGEPSKVTKEAVPRNRVAAAS